MTRARSAVISSLAAARLSRAKPDEIHHLADRMAQKPAGFRVGPATAPLVIEALRAFADSLLRPEDVYRVEEWDRDGLHIVEVLAIAANHTVAKGAYVAALAARPGRNLCLSNGCRVVESNFDR